MSDEILDLEADWRDVVPTRRIRAAKAINNLWLGLLNQDEREIQIPRVPAQWSEAGIVGTWVASRELRVFGVGIYLFPVGGSAVKKTAFPAPRNLVPDETLDATILLVVDGKHIKDLDAALAALE